MSLLTGWGVTEMLLHYQDGFFQKATQYHLIISQIYQLFIKHWPALHIVRIIIRRHHCSSISMKFVDTDLVYFPVNT